MQFYITIAFFEGPCFGQKNLYIVRKFFRHTTRYEIVCNKFTLALYFKRKPEIKQKLYQKI